jgi:hypothetical protein
MPIKNDRDSVAHVTPGVGKGLIVWASVERDSGEFTSNIAI